MAQNATDADDRDAKKFSRIAEKRPVGAVHCSGCDENKDSGADVRFETTRAFGTPGETETRLLCDYCIRKIEKRFAARENEHGYIPVAWEAE